MTLRRSLLVGALAATAVVGAQSAALAAPATPHAAAASQKPLRAYAAPSGLRIGTAVNTELLGANARYTQIVDKEFSSVTPENVMKWEVVEPQRGVYDWSGADELVASARANGQLVRGHTLLWHSQVPAWLTTGVNNGSITKTELREIVRQHILTEVGRYKGKIWQWDVANEFIANSWEPNRLPDGVNADDFWVKNLGEGIIADAFRWAHEADPGALLFYNDYNITGEDGSNAKYAAAYNLVKNLKAQGVPIDGVGEQLHLDTQYGFNTATYRADLKAFAALGLKVAITEADVRTFVDSAATQKPVDSTVGSKLTAAQEVATQNAWYASSLQGCVDLPQCISYTVWGPGDAYSWIPGVFTGEGSANLYDVNLEKKSEYFALQKVLAAGAPKRS